METAKTKKYSLNRSYYKYRDVSDPDTLLEIVRYYNEKKELPFEYSGTNWVYDAMCERQKKNSIQYSQYLCPDVTATQMANLADNFEPENLEVLNACCGAGQLSRAFIKKGYKVWGFDKDPDMVEACHLLFPGEHTFFKLDYTEAPVAKKRWDLITAYPPFEANDLLNFLNWLTYALSANGVAILLMPEQLPKKNMSLAKSILQNLTCIHIEEPKELTPHSKSSSRIWIVKLSEAYRQNLEITTNETDRAESIPEKLPTPVAVSEAVKEPEIQPEKQETPTLEIPDVPKPALSSMDDEMPVQTEVKLSEIRLNPLNPRKKIRPQELEELAKSIEELGLLHPIVLNRKPDGFEIICGERRFRAFQLNGSKTIPAEIRQVSDAQALLLALAENIQREDLEPLDEALTFSDYLSTRQISVEDIALRIGKSVTYVNNRLALLKLTKNHQALLRDGTLSLGKAIELARYPESIQEKIYTGFTLADDQSWLNLSAKGLKSKIERAFTCDLDQYDFDKKTCKTCEHNTANYNLFLSAESGKCLFAECLEKKKIAYLSKTSEKICQENQTAILHVSPLTCTPELEKALHKKHITVLKTTLEEVPELPQKPLREQFKSDEEFNKAMYDYNSDLYDYGQEMEKIEADIKEDKAIKVPYVTGGKVKEALLIKSAKSSRETQTDKPEKSSVVNKIEFDLQCVGNEQIRILDMAAASVQEVIKKQPVEVPVMEEFEESLFYVILTDFLRREHYALFGLKETHTSLTESEKVQLVKGITEEQKKILKMDFMAAFLVNKRPLGTGFKQLLLQFAARHFPKLTTPFLTNYRRDAKKLAEEKADLKKQLEEHQRQLQKEQPVENI